MFENFLMQTGSEAFVNSAWGLFLAIAAIFATISGIAIKIATNIKNKLKDSNNEQHKKIVSIIDDYVLPILDTGNDFVVKTKDQEVKLKEFGQILYNFMGPEADKITEKPKVKIDNLTADVTSANIKADDYRIKLERLMELMGELKGEPAAAAAAAAKPIAQAKTQAKPIP